MGRGCGTPPGCGEDEEIPALGRIGRLELGEVGLGDAPGTTGAYPTIVFFESSGADGGAELAGVGPPVLIERGGVGLRGGGPAGAPPCFGKTTGIPIIVFFTPC
ncbi:MAG: hypothetical protein KC609_01180 [Myxococcales bacterium]|nr:hypothetical protein [Myxococcales bacterium]